MWTEDNKRSNANHIAWINLIQSNKTHCAKLGLVRAQKSGDFLPEQIESCDRRETRKTELNVIDILNGGEILVN